MGRYATVAGNEFFLKRIFKSTFPGEPHLTADEILEAEEWVDDYIEGRLGLTFPSGTDTPPLIRSIARKLLGHRLRHMLLAGNAPNQDEHTQNLLDEANEELDAIMGGRLAVRLRDTTVHPVFDGPSGGRKSAENPDEERRFHVQKNRPFERMDHLNNVEQPVDEKFSDPNYDQETSDVDRIL